MSVWQLLATWNLIVADNVPAVTPPPTQPPTLAPVIWTVGLTFVVLPTFGNPGLNVAAPLAFVHAFRNLDLITLDLARIAPAQ